MSSQTKKRLKKGVNSLNASYYSGLIAYPRVDNTYIRPEFSLDLFPHPPISRRIYKPLIKKDSIRINKDEMMLYLSSTRVITPRQIESTFDYIDYYLDDLLEARTKVRETEALKMISLLNDFLEKENILESTIMDYRNTFYKNCYQNAVDSVLFIQSSAHFLSLNDKNRTKCEYYVIIRQTKENNPFSRPVRFIKKSVTEAMHAFRDEYTESFDLSEKENIIQTIK